MGQGDPYSSRFHPYTTPDHILNFNLALNYTIPCNVNRLDTEEKCNYIYFCHIVEKNLSVVRFHSDSELLTKP